MFQLILIAAAVIPAVYLLIRVYRADRLEKEPTGLLVSLVLLGILSTALAALAEALGSLMLIKLFPQRGMIYNALLYFVVVGISEEGAKYLLLRARTWKSPHFNFRFDGVVYAVFVSLGFALWENIRYVLTFGFGTAVARAVTAIPGHACFGVFMGVWYGVAKKYELSGLEAESRDARKMALVIPILLHGAYDFIASMESELMSIVFLLFVGWMFRSALNLVKKTSAEDSSLTQQNDVFNVDI